MVQSKSGTGKTLIFTLIALENVDTMEESVQTLVIAPAREIALQTEDVIRQIGCCIEGKYLLSSACFLVFLAIFRIC